MRCLKAPAPAAKKAAAPKKAAPQLTGAAKEIHAAKSRAYHAAHRRAMKSGLDLDAAKVAAREAYQVVSKSFK